MYGKCDSCGKDAELEEYKGRHFCKMCVLNIRFDDRHKNDVKTTKKGDLTDAKRLENNIQANIPNKIENVVIANDVVKKEFSLKEFLVDVIKKLFRFIKLVFLIIKWAVPITMIGTILGISFGFLSIENIWILFPLMIIGACFYHDERTPEEKQKSLEEWARAMKETAEWEKQQAYEKLADRIDRLKSERDSITIKNGIFLGGNLSDYELKCNRRKWDELNRQINDLECELKNKF